ncbi:hypothetical protein IFM89_036067 [Coptis chinensis]|uniref:Ribosomal RNA-processing protein 43 n=1 Tax=Coptis chinensis TaxID=261450 RepID=A0A835HWK3_9MAGN|nr:hypothetical protein IFM89_036067 [Coptis chinensis]
MDASENLAGEMLEVDAFRRLFPLRFYERHLLESIRPDARPLGKARDTTVALGGVAFADGSALVKTGHTTMLADIKMEIITPSVGSRDEASLAIDFHMPPICSPLIRPGRPAEVAAIISKQLTDAIVSIHSHSHVLNRQDVYCLDADGSLFDAALLSAVAAFSHLHIPAISVNDDGRVVAVSEEEVESNLVKEPFNQSTRKLKLSCMPFSLTCILHKKHILADPTGEEESVMESFVTVVLDLSGQLVSFNKPGGPVLAYTSAVQDCIALTRQRVKELQNILNDAIADMELD